MKPLNRGGRPPAVWYAGPTLAEVAPGTIVSIDTSGGHRARLVGRVLRAADTATVVLRDRMARVVDVDVEEIGRYRIMPGPVFPVGRGCWHVPAKQRVVVIDQRDEDQYLVEDVDGVQHWVFEGDLAWTPPPLPPLKHGPVAADPVTETINAAALADRGEDDETVPLTRARARAMYTSEYSGQEPEAETRRHDVSMTADQGDNTRTFRMSAQSHTRLRAIAEAESRSMTAQLDLIVAEWMGERGYIVSRGKVKRDPAAASA